MKLKDWIEKCNRMGVWCHVLYEGDIYLIYHYTENGYNKSAIAIKHGENYPTADGHKTDKIFNHEDEIIHVIVIRNDSCDDSYDEPEIAYRYDTKQVIFEFDHWTI